RARLGRVGDVAGVLLSCFVDAQYVRAGLATCDSTGIERSRLHRSDRNMTTAEQSTGLRIRPDWLATRREEPLDADLAVVDAHHHLYDRPGLRYLFDDAYADFGSGHKVIGTVVVQARAMLRADGPGSMRAVGETEFVNGIAAMSASGIYGSSR